MKVKYLNRLGKFLIISGISLVLVAFVRSITVFESSEIVGIGSSQSSHVTSYFWFPRNLRLQVDSEIPLTLSITDPTGATLLNAENIQQDLFTLNLNYRGTYTIAVTNPSNQTTSTFTRLGFTSYGVEKDLIQASIILTVAGIIAIAANKAQERRSR